MMTQQMTMVNVIIIVSCLQIGSTHLAWSRSCQPPSAHATFNQINWLNSHNGCAMMTAPWTLYHNSYYYYQTAIQCRKKAKY